MPRQLRADLRRNVRAPAAIGGRVVASRGRREKRRVRDESVIGAGCWRGRLSQELCLSPPGRPEEFLARRMHPWCGTGLFPLSPYFPVWSVRALCGIKTNDFGLLPIAVRGFPRGWSSRYDGPEGGGSSTQTRYTALSGPPLPSLPEGSGALGASFHCETRTVPWLLPGRRLLRLEFFRPVLRRGGAFPQQAHHR
jgi:hypothetical protein